MPKAFPAVVVVSLAILSCRSADTGRVDPRLAAFIPADTVLVAGIRVEEIRATPVYRKLQAQDRLYPLESLKTMTGVDARTDVSDLVVASNGKSAVTIARGQFHPADSTATKSAYKGYALYTRPEGAWALIHDSIALAGTEAAVRAAIDQSKSGSRPPALAALLARSGAIPSQNQVWMISSGGPELFGKALAQSDNAANFNKVFGQLDQITLVADLHAGLNLVITGDCRTEQDAKTLSEALRGLVSLGKLSVPANQKEFLRFYDAVQVDQQLKSVKLAASLPPELIDSLLTMTDPGPRVTPRKKLQKNF